MINPFSADNNNIGLGVSQGLVDYKCGQTMSIKIYKSNMQGKHEWVIKR